jgi:hypothetical protein
VPHNSIRLVLIDNAAPEQVSDVGGQRIDLAPIAIDGQCEELTVCEPEVLIESSFQFGCLAL